MTLLPLTATPCATPARKGATGLSGRMTIFLAVAVGVIFLNVPAPQTLVGVIGRDIGLSPALYGLVATAPLLGYAAGLFLVTPLADLLENRGLITKTLGAAVLLAAATAYAYGPALLLPALFLLGLASAAVQMVVPLAAAMAGPDHRGRAVGDVMSGLMIGIMMSRPVASLVEHAFGWRAFYAGSAVALLLVTLGLALALPERRPATTGGYGALLASLVALVRDEPVLRRRAFTAGLGMAAFSVFWTAVAFELSGSGFGLTQTGIAVFALAGAGGAVIAPLAGRAGDRGWTRRGTLLAHVAMLLAFAGAYGGGLLGHWPGILVLAASAIVLDMGVVGEQTLGRRAINMLRPEAGARLNGLFVGLFFIGGSIGTALTGLVWTHAGWAGICALGAGFAALALLSDLLPSRTRQTEGGRAA